MIWLRVLAFTVFLPGLIMVYAPYLWIVTPPRARAMWPPDPWHAPALAVIAVGMGIYLVCAWRFATEGHGTPAPWDPPRTLVTGGMYRWSRNPMYVGIVGALFGEAWLMQSGAQAVYALAIAAMFHLRVIMYEEPKLRELFGDQFTTYSSRVRRWGVI